MSNKYWGYELVINASDCNKISISSYNTIYTFVKDLVEKIEMVAYGEPHIVEFGTGNKAGYTLVQLIETSNICAHFVPDNGEGRSDMYLNVFSCKEFDINIVMDLVQKYFGAQKMNPFFMYRQA